MIGRVWRAIKCVIGTHTVRDNYDGLCRVGVRCTRCGRWWA